MVGLTVALLACVASVAVAQTTTTLAPDTTTLPPDTTTTETSTTTTETLPPPETTTTAPEPPSTTVTIPVPTTITLPVPTTITIPVPTTLTFVTTTTSTTIPLTCLPGTALGCDDANPCTLDVCNPLLGCQHFALPDTSPCDDGDACTEGDACTAGRCAGQPKKCDDGVACTADACVAGACVHAPHDALCDRAQCEVGACRPADAKADRRGCVAVAVREGQPCTDDGFPCTDDVCTGGACLHVPVDSRCVVPGACTTSACEPTLPAHDAVGCVAGPPAPEGAACAEDGDPCTFDSCANGVCAHTPEPDAAACTPVQAPFRQAIGLQNLTQGLAASLAPADSATVAPLLQRLTAIEDAFASAAEALADGTNPLPAVAGGMQASPDISVADRAHIAFTMVLRTPRQVSQFLQLLAEARVRAAVGPPAARSLRQRAHVLLRSTRHFRRALKRVAG